MLLVSLVHLGDVKLFVAAHDEKVTGVSLKHMINKGKTVLVSF